MKDKLVSFSLVTTLTFLLFTSGCVSQKLKSDTQLEGDEHRDIYKLTSIVLSYSERNNHLPDTKENLINFCSESNVACPPLDWDEFALQKKDEGTIEITHKKLNLTFPMSSLKEKEDTKKMENLLFGEN